MFRGGPRGTAGQYGGVRSRVCKGTLNPTWKREWVEVRLQGGTMSSDGEYDNPHAPWSSLRLEIWDRDAFTADDFIGQVHTLGAPSWHPSLAHPHLRSARVSARSQCYSYYARPRLATTCPHWPGR